jgi:hypothetical protein
MEGALIPALAGDEESSAQRDAEPKPVEAALAERIKHLEAIQAMTKEMTRELDLTMLLSLIIRERHQECASLCHSPAADSQA